MARALQTIAPLLPLTNVASLLQGTWRGEGWLAHARYPGALAIVFVVCVAIAARAFRWE